VEDAKEDRPATILRQVYELRADVLCPPRPSGLAKASGCTLALLDPPYNQGRR